MTDMPVISPCTVVDMDDYVLLSLRGRMSRRLTPGEARAVAHQLNAMAEIADRHRNATEPVGLAEAG